MALEVIGAGFGRTGTMSLRMALNTLGLGPTYHMEDVLQDMPTRVPQWNAALDGNPDWRAIYDGFHSAVDWPTATFWRELSEHYPNAKFILSTRNPQNWYKSISQTILKVLTAPDDWPAEQVEWLSMVSKLALGRSLQGRTDRQGVLEAFHHQEIEVKETLPSDRLLVFRARDGWEPLCTFLGKPIPNEPYPRSNSREEFFELMAQNAGNSPA